MLAEFDQISELLTELEFDFDVTPDTSATSTPDLSNSNHSTAPYVSSPVSYISSPVAYATYSPITTTSSSSASNVLPTLHLSGDVQQPPPPPEIFSPDGLGTVEFNYDTPQPARRNTIVQAVHTYDDGNIKSPTLGPPPPPFSYNEPPPPYVEENEVPEAATTLDDLLRSLESAHPSTPAPKPTHAAPSTSTAHAAPITTAPPINASTVFKPPATVVPQVPPQPQPQASSKTPAKAPMMADPQYAHLSELLYTSPGNYRKSMALNFTPITYAAEDEGSTTMSASTSLTYDESPAVPSVMEKLKVQEEEVRVYNSDYSSHNFLASVTR